MPWSGVTESDDGAETGVVLLLKSGVVLRLNTSGLTLSNETGVSMQAVGLLNNFILIFSGLFDSVSNFRFLLLKACTLCMLRCCCLLFCLLYEHARSDIDPD